jgi:type I restriction enzyme S subunit
VNFVKVESLTEDGRFLPSKFAFVTEACHTEFKRSQLQEGDILISIAGTLGRTAIVTKHLLPANTNQALAIVRLEQGVPIHTVKREFVVRFIQNSTEQIASIRSGTAQPNLSLTQLKNFLIPIPPIKEQERIVEVLDEAFAAIDKAKANIERNLTNARELFQSRLNDIFSNPSEDWEVKPLGEVCTVKGGKRLPKGRKLENGDNGHPYLTVSDFNDHGSVDMKEIKFVPLDVVPLIERYIIHTTDVYLSIAGTIGKTGIIPRALDGCNLTENAAKLSPNSELDTRFLYWFTRSPRFQNESGARTRTTAQPKLALTRVRSIPLMIPTMQEQSRIVNELDVFQEDLLELESTYSGQIDNLEELRQSILERAFEGKLTEPVAA